MKIETLSYGLSVKHHAYPVVAVGKMDISGNSQPLRQIDEITHPRQSFISVLLRAPLILQLKKLKKYAPLTPQDSVANKKLAHIYKAIKKL